MTLSMFPNGIGGTLGSRLATCKPLLTSGNVWYVDTTNGVDAGGSAGQNRESPLLTLAQAVTNSSAGHAIVLINNSTVALTGAQSIAGRYVLGEGEASGVPSSTITFNGAGQLTMGSAGGELRNVRITARSAASGASTPRVLVSASSQLVEDCYFDCDANDDASALSLATSLANITVRGCTFVSTATSTSRPVMAMDCAGTSSDLALEDCVFDAGTYGWSATWALDISAGIITRLKGIGLSFLRGADWGIHASSTGYFNVATATGGSRGSW